MSFWTTGAARVKVAGAVVAAISLGGFAVAAASVAKEPEPTVGASEVTSTTDTSATTTPTDPPVTEPTTVPTDPPVTDTTTPDDAPAAGLHGLSPSMRI